METNEITRLSGYQKIVIFILAMTQFTVILDFMVMSPLGDMLIKSLSMKPSSFGVAVSAYAFSAGISGLLTAGFADRFDRKKLLLFFYTGFIIGTFLCSLATSYEVLVVARIITGLFGGVIGSISMAIITDLFTLQQRGRVMGYVQMGFGASQVLGIPIGLYIANQWGWESPFVMVAALGIILAIFIVVKLKPINKHLGLVHEKTAFKHLLHTVSKRNYRIGFASTAVLSIGGFMMMPFGSVFAVNNLHVTAKELPVLFMISGVSSLLIMPMVGRLSDKMSKFKIFAMASILMMIICVAYTNLSATPFWIVIIFNIFMMIAVMSRMIPSSALTSAIPEPEDRGAFMSINASMQQIAGGVAAAVSGIIVVQKTEFSPLVNYNIVGYVVFVISLIGIYLVHRVDQLAAKKVAKNGEPAEKVEMMMAEF